MSLQESEKLMLQADGLQENLDQSRYAVLDVVRSLQRLSALVGRATRHPKMTDAGLARVLMEIETMKDQWEQLLSIRGELDAVARRVSGEFPYLETWGKQ